MSESRTSGLQGASLTLPFAGDAQSTTKRADLPALEAVFRDHSSRLKSLAYNLLGSQADAEDAVQEAFLKTYRAWSTFDNRASLPTWVYRILINTCLDETRRRKRRPEGAITGPTGADLPIAAPEANADLKLALRQAIGELDARQRTIFLMASVEGLPHAEIAAILEISETNSRTLLLEARRNLQKRLTR